jgi:hypothetical protein
LPKPESGDTQRNPHKQTKAEFNTWEQIDCTQNMLALFQRWNYYTRMTYDHCLIGFIFQTFKSSSILITNIKRINPIWLKNFKLPKDSTGNKAPENSGKYIPK